MVKHVGISFITTGMVDQDGHVFFVLHFLVDMHNNILWESGMI